MISEFEAAVHENVDEFLTVFGTKVMVRGVSFLVIFDEEEYQDESGYRKEITIDFKQSDAKTLKKGDEVYLDEAMFKVLRIPRVSAVDPFVKVEVQLVS